VREKVFVAEMLLSYIAVLAAAASLLDAEWNIVFRILPSILWLAMLTQCVISFGWRGFWFLASVPLTLGAVFVLIFATLLGHPLYRQLPLVLPGRFLGEQISN
jgi:hypothetical protein